MTSKVKSILVFILMMTLCAFSNKMNAQKSNTIEFHTSAQCGMCKETIEGAMNYERGIQFVELNMENMFLTVKYNCLLYTSPSPRD